MLLTASENIPLDKDWLYETKYDGFRCILEWEVEPILKSRNENILNKMFPEIIQFCYTIEEQVKPHLPLVLDGEIVHLINSYKSHFTIVQTRGRMRKKEAIESHLLHFPCHLAIFDLLIYKGKDITNKTLAERKEKLSLLFKNLKLPLNINSEDNNRLQMIELHKDSKPLWEKIVAHNGEGMVAKKEKSRWTSDKRSTDWLKIKNWKITTIILTVFDKSNNYFFGAIYDEGQLVDVVNFSHGLMEEELVTLQKFFYSNGQKIGRNKWQIEPSICVDIASIDFDGKSLREPRFHRFNFECDPLNCTRRKFYLQLYSLPENVKVTHPDKPLWISNDIKKEDYLYYLQRVSSYMLPFLRDRLLTVIRYPHGAISDELFYQKNWEDNVPNYVKTKFFEDNRHVLCNNIETLLWLGNQIALEFHIPFQTIHSELPTEIVFDLDPPSVDYFWMAVDAALKMKAIFDNFSLVSFIKTSGGKGLQIYIPLPKNLFSYEETRIFTKFVCDFLCEQNPDIFTTERMKKNRNNKLYLDYVQHHEGKTIIAPYSTRGNDGGFVATPLKWEEVNKQLSPTFFSIPIVLERIEKHGNLFNNFWHVENGEAFKKVLEQLKNILNIHKS